MRRNIAVLRADLKADIVSVPVGVKAHLHAGIVDAEILRDGRLVRARIMRPDAML